MGAGAPAAEGDDTGRRGAPLPSGAHAERVILLADLFGREAREHCRRCSPGRTPYGHLAGWSRSSVSGCWQSGASRRSCRAAGARSARAACSIRSTSKPTAWRRSPGCAASPGTPVGSRRPGRAISAWCSGRSRPRAGSGRGDRQRGHLLRSARARRTRVTAFSLELALGWAYRSQPSRKCRSAGLVKLLMRLQAPAGLRGTWPLPARGPRVQTGAWSATRRTGSPIPANDPYSTTGSSANGVKNIEAAVNLVAGWYDIFLPGLLRDFHRLRRRPGRAPHHRPLGALFTCADRGGDATVHRGAARHLIDSAASCATAVGVYVTGAD